MKKLLVAVALVFAATTASAAVIGGSHDLSIPSNQAKYGAPELSSCQFCHAPHFGTVAPPAGGPLWNRSVPAPVGGYTLYSSGTLSLVASAGKALGTNSFTCLSCHDGVSDMGATLVGSRGFTAATTMTGFALVGTVLTNDHPVGITYNTGDTTLVNGPPPGVPTATTVGLYGGKVECGSCHDPHATSNQATGGASFLRQSSATICTSCHNK